MYLAPPRRDAGWHALAALVLLAIVIAQFWPGLSRDLSPPISWDHGSHLGKAMLTWERLPSLRAWTDLIETGVPLNTVYTATGTLLLLIVRVFTQHLEWTQTYAVALVVVRWLVALSVYRLAIALRAGVAGALVAGVIYLADFGDHSEAGWFYEVQFGVWPMSLAIAAFFVGVAEWLDFLDEGTRARGASAAIWLGVALFSHQATLLAIGSVVPAIVLVRMTSARTDLRRDVERIAPVLAAAGLIALWWLLPMFGFTAWLDDHGQLYWGTPDIGHRFLVGEGILRGGPYTSVLAAVGLAYGLFTGDVRRRALACGALVAMIVASPGWLLLTDALRYLPSLGRIVFPRMLTIAKPILFALAGVVVGDLVERLRRSRERWLGSMRGKLGVALSCALLAPFLVRAPEALDAMLLSRDYVSTASLGEWESWREAWRWVRAQRAEEPDAGFYRVFWFHEGTHLGQASPAFTGVPGHVSGVLVGEAFRNTSDGTHPDALRAMNVRYVVAFQDLPYALRSETTLVATLGQASVYELRAWTSEVVSDLDGRVHPRVLHLEDERVVVRPEGATHLLVRRAYAPPMRAYADGREIPIGLERVVDSPHLRLMRLEVPEGTERVEVRYTGLGWRGIVGWLGTLLGLFAVLAYASFDRWPETWRSTFVERWNEARRAWLRVPPRLRHPVERRWPHALLVLPLLALALLVAKNARGYHVAHRLHEVELRHRSSPDVPASPCSGGRGNCAELGGLHLGADAVCVDGWYRSCVTAGPPSRGVLIVDLPRAPRRGVLSLGGGVADDAWQRGDGPPITVRAFAGEAALGVLEVPNGRHWESAEFELSDQGPLRLEIEGGAPGRRSFCFDAIVR